MRGIFISPPCNGQVYVAERSRKFARRLLWSVMPFKPVAPDTRIDAALVPLVIRRAAYRALTDTRSLAQRAVRGRVTLHFCSMEEKPNDGL